jgi:rod shape-determining protein MreB
MGKFSISGGESLAIDLGNNNTILVNKSNSLMFHPSFVALNTNNNSVKAVGMEAYDMVGKTNPNLRVVKPLRGGVIDDFESTGKMLQELVARGFRKRSIFSRFENIIASVPFSTTNVEKRALRDVIEQINPSKVSMVFEPIAAAIGMGCDVQEPGGKFVLDIGGGITEAVVISLSGIVNANSSRIAGDAFDQDIQDYLRRKHKIEISLQMAEKVKISVGAVSQHVIDPPDPYYAIGKDTITGVPRGIFIDYREIAEILDNSLNKIEQIVYQTLEECQPELSGDICKNGILVTGGGSLLRGMKERLQKKFNIPVQADANPLLSVTWGNRIILQNLKKYRSVLLN